MADATPDPRIRYALAVLLDACNPVEAAWPDWLAYAQPEELAGRRAVCIVPSGFFGADYGSHKSLPTPPLQTIHGVPLLFGDPFVQRDRDILVVRADIVASAYFLLTRYEEWVRTDVRDEHGRFPGKESLPCRAGFIDRPVVEQYSELLRQWARAVGIDLPQPRRRFSVLLTHDVDSIGSRLRAFQPLRSLLSAMLGRQSWRQAVRTSTVALRLADDPFDNIAEVVRLDRSLLERVGPELCRTVYFFMGGRHFSHDANYHIQDPPARRALDCVLSASAEVGLHASYGAGQWPELVAGERAALEQVVGRPVHKNRHHYLAWREPADGQALAKAGICWDSTLGYADVAGFRLGVCRPIPLFDPADRCLFGIEEHPLIVMDCTLSEKRYLGLDEEAAFACVRRLAEVTCRYRGEFVILWHNTVLAPADANYHPRLYPRILDHLAQLLSGGEQPLAASPEGQACLPTSRVSRGITEQR
jgi:hypothetical protein